MTSYTTASASKHGGICLMVIRERKEGKYYHYLDLFFRERIILSFDDLGQDFLLVCFLESVRFFNQIWWCRFYGRYYLN